MLTSLLSCAGDGTNEQQSPRNSNAISIVRPSSRAIAQSVHIACARGVRAPEPAAQSVSKTQPHREDGSDQKLTIESPVMPTNLPVILSWVSKAT